MAIVLFLQLQIPLYWLVADPRVSFWRIHNRPAYITGLLCSSLPVTVALVVFRREFFRSAWASTPVVVIALVLITFEFWIFWRVHRDLGGSRLVGIAELSGGEIESQGIYARVLHPR